MGKYFTVEVKPTIPNVAAGQHTAFANGDILFDWFSFDIPKGAARLIGASVELRPKGDAGATPNKFALELMLAKSKSGVAPVTLGTVNSAPTAVLNPDRMITYLPIVAGDFGAELDSISFAQATPKSPVVFEGETYTGTNAGYDKYYIAGIAGDAIDFRSGCTINNGDLNGPIITVADVDPRLFLAVGDTIAATTTADTSVAKSMGVIKSMADANTITLESDFGDIHNLTNDDFVYNTTPLKVVLHFER